MCYHGRMIDCPIAELMDESLCTLWLERHLHPPGLTCPPAGSGARHGTYAHDRPPIISVISRETGEQRFWVCDHADTGTCHAIIADNVPAGSGRLSTDAWQSYRGSHVSHGTVCHGVHAWARDDAGDGRREVHGHACEGVWVRRSGRPCVSSGVSTSHTCISMWQPMKPWSMPHGSRPS
jgi:hypothetical protein